MHRKVERRVAISLKLGAWLPLAPSPQRSIPKDGWLADAKLRAGVTWAEQYLAVIVAELGLSGSRSQPSTADA
jgi:hypothetical protein